MRMAVQQIKENPFFKDPPIIICAENAPGLAGPEMALHVQDIPGVWNMAEWDSKGTVGVPARNEITEAMTVDMEARLAQGRIVFSENLMGYPVTMGGQRLETLKRNLGIQLLGWERIVEYRSDKPLSKPKTGWSAKQSAGNDDIARAALMGWWRTVFFSAERHDRYGDIIEQHITPRIIANLNSGIAPTPMRIEPVDTLLTSAPEPEALPMPRSKREMEGLVAQSSFTALALSAKRTMGGGVGDGPMVTVGGGR